MSQQSSLFDRNPGSSRLFEFTPEPQIFHRTSQAAISRMATYAGTVVRKKQLAGKPVYPLWVSEILREAYGVPDDAPFGVVDTLPHWAEDYKTLIDNRDRWLDKFEENEGFALTLVDRHGRPAIRGGAPIGVVPKTAPAGQLGERVQVRMSGQKMMKIARRHREAGLITPVDEATVIEQVGAAQLALGVPPEPVPPSEPELPLEPEQLATPEPDPEQS